MKGSDKKRIVFLAKFLPPYRGGMERFAEHACKAFFQAGHHVTLVGAGKASSSSSPSWCSETLNLPHRGKLLSQPLFFSCSKLEEALKRADIIFHNYPNPLIDHYSLAIESRAKRYVFFHSEIYQSWARAFVRKKTQEVLRKSEKIFVSSPQNLGFSDLGPFSHKCRVIPFGTQQKSRSEKDQGYILSVGRLVPYKGFPYLIRAMENLDVPLKIVGEGPQKGALQRMINNKRLENKVELVGQVSDRQLDELYKNCRLFVLPSVTSQETFGVSLIEAMAHGKPVVTTQLVTGVSYVNQENVTGAVAQVRSVNNLREKISEILADPVLRDRMGRAAHMRVARLFSIERMRRSLLENMNLTPEIDLAPDMTENL